MAKTTWKGAEQLKKNMALLPPAYLEGAKKAIEKNADALVDMAKRLAPKGSSLDLTESIRWYWAGSNEDLGSGSGGLRAGRTSVIAAKGALGIAAIVAAGNAKAFYARWQEFGTVNQPGQPFFYVSYRALRRSSQARMATATRTAARQILGVGKK